MSAVPCYLCGLPIAGVASEDHVVPKQLLDRAQPRAKGFDYAGTLPTHEECNNRFGPERYFRSARKLLDVLSDETSHVIAQHPDDPTVKIFALDGSRLHWMDPREQAFFKFINAPSEIDGIPDADFFRGKAKTNPVRDAVVVALSVLAKSAGALLISRYLGHEVPSHWRIYATAYQDESEKFDLDESVGQTVPFDTAVKVWVKKTPTADWQVAYRAGSLVVILLFLFSTADGLVELRKILLDEDIFYFDGAVLNEVLTAGWKLM